MHELSVAMSIVEIACEEGERLGGRVCAVHVRLGGVSGIVREALQTSFEAACMDTPLAGSQLVIEAGAPGGQELQLVALEIEE